MTQQSGTDNLTGNRVSAHISSSSSEVDRWRFVALTECLQMCLLMVCVESMCLIVCVPFTSTTFYEHYLLRALPFTSTLNMELPDEILSKVMTHAQSTGNVRVVHVINDNGEQDQGQDQEVLIHELHITKTPALRALACTSTQHSRLYKNVLRKMAHKAYNREVEPTSGQHMVFVEFKNKHD